MLVCVAGGGDIFLAGVLPEIWPPIHADSRGYEKNGNCLGGWGLGGDGGDFSLRWNPGVRLGVCFFRLRCFGGALARFGRFGAGRPKNDFTKP